MTNDKLARLEGSVKIKMSLNQFAKMQLEMHAKMLAAIDKAEGK